MELSAKRQQQKIGELGEQIIAAWLATQGWTLRHHRWRCRWGELDLVVEGAPDTPMLVFVEVKTRSFRNWDQGGLLAITPQKQAKLVQAAQMYLATFPELADVPCRFDLALVSYRRARGYGDSDSSQIQQGQPIYRDGYVFAIAQYLDSIVE
jgi:putative endonuclease